MIDQDRTQDLKLEGRQFYAGGLWVAFRSPLGPGQSPSAQGAKSPETPEF